MSKLVRCSSCGAEAAMAEVGFKNYWRPPTEWGELREHDLCPDCIDRAVGPAPKPVAVGPYR